MSEKSRKPKKEISRTAAGKQYKEKTKRTEKVQQERKSKKNSGLTLPEKQRLKQLRQLLFGHGHSQEKPATAQRTIPFQTMEKDGICQVNAHFFTKMVEFYDINYELLDVREQGDILNSYSQFINYFDPSIHVQLFLFNRQVDEKTLVTFHKKRCGSII